MRAPMRLRRPRSCPASRARPRRWRLRIQPQVGEDLLDHRPLQDGRDELQFAATAVGTVRHVDGQDSLEQPRPANAVRPYLDPLLRQRWPRDVAAQLLQPLAVVRIFMSCAMRVCSSACTSSSVGAPTDDELRPAIGTTPVHAVQHQAQTAARQPPAARRITGRTRGAWQAEGQKPVVAAAAAAQPRQAVGQDAALEEGVELVLDEPGQLGAGAGVGMRDEAGCVLLYQAVQRGLLRAVACTACTGLDGRPLPSQDRPALGFARRSGSWVQEGGPPPGATDGVCQPSAGLAHFS